MRKLLQFRATTITDPVEDVVLVEINRVGEPEWRSVKMHNHQDVTSLLRAVLFKEFGLFNPISVGLNSGDLVWEVETVVNVQA